ncbi:MAG: putative hemolysin [Minisyncoccota bacterium]|jgi:hypothetical protein
MTSNTSLISAAILLVVLLAAYGYVSVSRFEVPQPKTVQMANPASTHCADVGGTLEIREDAAGAQAGYCVLQDGRVCEEWALFRDNTCTQPQQ